MLLKQDDQPFVFDGVVLGDLYTGTLYFHWPRLFALLRGQERDGAEALQHLARRRDGRGDASPCPAAPASKRDTNSIGSPPGSAATARRPAMVGCSPVSFFEEARPQGARRRQLW